MDSTPEQEIPLRAPSIPLSRRIFSIFILLGIANIAIFGLLAFISKREQQREVVHYRNEQWLTFGIRYIHSAMDSDYLDLSRLANSEFLQKSNLKELSANLEDATKSWPGVYIEVINEQGNVLASGGASAALAARLRGIDESVRLSALNKVRQNQRFVDIVNIDNSIFLQAATPVPIRGNDKTASGDSGKHLLMHKELDRPFMRSIQTVIDHHVGLIPAGVYDPAYIMESIPGNINSIRYIAPLENGDNKFPIQRFENIDGKNKLVSYTPIRNQTGQILAYLFVVDSGEETPGTDLGIILIGTAAALFCLLLALAFHASRHIKMSVGQLRAALNAALSPQDAPGYSGPEWRKLYFSRQLGDIADLVQKLVAMADENRIALDYALKDKNSVLIDFQEYQEAVESLDAEKRASEETYQELFNESPQGLFHIDEDSHFIVVNESLAHMLGYSDPAQYMSETSSFSEQVAPASDWDEIRLRLANSESLTQEIKLTRRDQTSLHVSLQIKRKDLAQDSSSCVYYGMVTDLSERMRLREAESQCRAASAASNYKSQFLARMSHEIRTPLNAIIGMSELMYETRLSEEQTEYMDILKNAGQSLLGIINDILDFSKVESGKMTLERIPVDIADLVGKIGHQFELAARNKNLDFELQIDPSLPPRVGCDPLRLRQILGNLLANAIKFTEKGKVSLSVRPHPEAPREIGATTLMFSVSDTGVGVSQQKQGNIFEDFIQADNSVTRRFGGTGLGLSICKILTEMMDGRIMLSSEENKGTTVHVTIRFEHLPFLAGDRDAAQAKPDSSMSRNTQGQDTPDQDMPGQVAEPIFTVRPVDPAPGKERNHQARPERTAQETRTSGNARIPAHGYGQGAAPAPYSGQYGGRDQEQYREQAQPSFDGLGGMDLNEAYAAHENDRLVYPGTDDEPRLPDDVIMPFYQPENPPSEPDDPRPLKILHVEDNANNRQIFSLYLRNTPHMLVEAHNGEEAVEAFREHYFDIIFMDIAMPLMDGYQATRILRVMEDEQGRPPTPILAITAHVLPEAREAMFAAGCNGFISKPYTKIDILNMIDKYVYGKA